MARPMLDELELQQVQTIELDGDQVWVQHDIPALEGDFLQGLGRRASQITLTGVLSGEEVADSLKNLRDKFRGAQPVSFVADIATATRLEQMLIEEMGIRELAGKAARFEYAFTLREYVPATPTETIIPPPPPPPPPPPVETAILEVQVIVEGQPVFDHTTTRVRVEGTNNDGQRIETELSERDGDVWTADPFPPGTYTATATTGQLTGSNSGTLLLGQKHRIIITLREGRATANAFLIHYWFDKAFVEPCMRHVLRKVAEYATQNPDRKLVIVGHTDESGSATYNQSLSERRARGAYAYLTFGRSPEDEAEAVAEWNELRQTRPTGTTRTLKDSWGVRQYQSMLQDLGFYTGPIGDIHDAATDQAVRDFQTANGLGVDGDVGDATWPVLIRAYLAQDNLAVPEEQFMPNVNVDEGCDHGRVQWMGCGEKMPVEGTPQKCEGPAWRPNRRTDLLFVNDDSFPCDDIPKPVTIGIRPFKPNEPLGWCLGTDQGSEPKKPCCFLTRNANEKDKWLVQSAEPGTFVVNGRITFEDGTPLANTPYILIAPDGEFMNGESTCGEDGIRKGKPFFGETDADGRLTEGGDKIGYPSNPKGVGTYTLEIQADVVARVEGQPISEATGPVVCKRLDGSSDFVVVVVSQAVVSVRPTITLASSVVVVKKPHTNPQRQSVTLGVNQAFTGSGTFTRSNDAIRFFDAAVGGNEITFNGVDNVFNDAQLAVGHTIFAEGSRVSAAVDDVELNLALTVNGTPGLVETANMTAVELTLQIAGSRPTPATDPPILSETDKISIGRFLQVADSSLQHERAQLIVQKAQPVDFTGELILTHINDRVEIFAAEQPASGQASLPDPQIIPNNTIQAGGTRFFVQGRTLSAAARDSGYRLGIRNVEADGDSVTITLLQIDMVTTASAAAPNVAFARMGLWDNAFRADGTVFNDAAEADNFVGADTRLFFIRVQDPSRQGAGHITAEWSAIDENGNDFEIPTDLTITLVESAVNTGIFISRALMLVTDDDFDQSTHSGLPAGIPDAGVRRNRNESNHRLRHATMLGDIRATVGHPQAVNARFRAQRPVFERNPESRRRLPLQIFVLRVAVGGAGVISTAAGSPLWAMDIRVLRETYERIGITVETVVAPGTPAGDIVTVDGDQVVLIDVTALNPPAGINPINVTLADEATIGGAFPAIPGTHTIRVFFTGGLASGVRGESAPDIDFAGAPDQATCFIDGVIRTPYTTAHEVGHILTDKSSAVNTGHYNAPALPANNRLHNDQNLMRNGTSASEGVNESKRLWDEDDQDSLNQFSESRGSHYTRNF